MEKREKMMKVGMCVVAWGGVEAGKGEVVLMRLLGEMREEREKVT